MDAVRIHIVVLAALTTLTFGWLLTSEHLWWVAGIAAFDWLVAILLSHEMPRSRALLRVFIFAVLCGSFGLFHAYEPTLTMVRVCFHLLAVFYNFALLPGRVRLKQIYIVKNVASCLGFVLTGFAYPLAKAQWGFAGLPVEIETMTLLCLGAFLFLFALAFETMIDLSLVPVDAAAGVESFPVVLGPELSVIIIDRLLAFSAIVLVVGFATHFVPWRIVVMCTAPLLQLLLFKRAVKRGFRPTDCVIITWALCGLLTVYHAWIFLRLPVIFSDVVG